MKPTHAHAAVSKAIADGQLQRTPCEICGNPRTHAHHDDYTKPLSVRWLCIKHHRQWHKEHPETVIPRDPMKKIISYSELRANLNATLDSVTDDLEPVIVRRRGKKDVVFMDAAELSSIMETWHLLKSPANAKALFEALDDVQSGKGIELTLEEFRSKKWLHQHAEV